MSDILIHRSQITADNLNARIDFDSAFGVDSEGNIIDAPNVYAPRVEHDATNDIYIEGDDWEAFSGGYSGQDRYNGPVMHASETLSGGLATDILSTPGTYVITIVEDECELDNPECWSFDSEQVATRATMGCECEPAGWIVLRYTK